MRKRDIDTVLKQINRIREALDMRPLSEIRKGEPANGSSCPVANSIYEKGFNVEPEVDTATITLRVWSADLKDLAERLRKKRFEVMDEDYGDGVSHLMVRTPTTMFRFIRDFDAEKLPEFDRMETSI